MAESAGIVGRGAELETLGHALAELDDGSGSMLYVVGEPGIGKTRLLAELHTRAHARRHLVLGGRAAEFERDLPFGLFVAALDDHLASLTDDRSAPALAAELGGIFPSLGHLAEGAPARLQEERYRAHRAVRGLLDGLSARRPVVLVLDDVHWADEASTELLCHLVAHRPAGPVLLALAMRPVGTSPRLTMALEQAARDGSAHRLELGPLSPDDARRLVGAPTDPRVYDESGGNPFYLQQLVRAGRAAGPTGAVNLADLAVPAAVRAALEGELEALSPPARRLLAGAAVSGESFEPELAAAAAGMDEAEALDLLDELVGLDVVRPTAVPRHFRFRHPIVRHGVYQSAGPGWRLTAHARLADVLAHQGASPQVRAHHVERSARAGDEAALALLEEAGRAAAPRAPATAARWYQAALRLLPHDQHERRLGLLVATATALASAGFLAESRSALLEAVDLLPPGHTPLASVRVRLIASCAAIEHLLGRHRDAHGRLTAALGELEDQGSPEAAALKLELAVDAIYTFDFPAMGAWATTAAADASALGAAPLEAAALALLGFAEYIRGATGPASDHLVRAGALVDGLADADLATQLDATYYLGWAENFMERFEEALRHTERGIALSQASGQGHLLVPLMLGRVYALVARGRCPEASELAEVAEDAARLSANPQSLSWALWVRALAATAAGDHTLALRSGEECMEVGRTVDHNVISATGGWVFGATLLEAGEPDRCRAEILASGGGPDLPLVGSGVRCTCYELLTRAELALGRREEAGAWAERAASAASELDLALARSAASRARSLMALEVGDPVRAAVLAMAAVGDAGAAGAAVDAARSRILLGRCLAAFGPAVANAAGQGAVI